MDLIKRLYESDNINLKRGDSSIYLYDDNNYDKIGEFLKKTYCFNNDLSTYEEFESILVKLFNKLGFSTNIVCLGDIVIGNSRYNRLGEGCFLFNYTLDHLNINKGDIVGYYASNELFDGEYTRHPGVQLISENNALYYFVSDNDVYFKKYELKVNDDLMITREFSEDLVLFILDSKVNGRFVIKIDKPNNMVVNDNYVLDNELELVESLKNIESYDVANIYNILSEISLGTDISIYPEITVSEMINTERGVMDKNLLTIIDGRLSCAVRTIGDKTLTLYGNGNWSYVINDEFVNFRINSGKTFKYMIEAKDNKLVDNYVETLLSFDVSKAKEEVETTKKLVKGLGIGVKKKG